MSFLLTEVALEMMGFKFYDLNGVCMGMNFQERSPETNPDLMHEPNLAELMGLPKSDYVPDTITETISIDDDDDDDDVQYVPQEEEPIKVIASAKVCIDDVDITDDQEEEVEVVDAVEVTNDTNETVQATDQAAETVANVATVATVDAQIDDNPELLYVEENLSDSIKYEYTKLYQEILYKESMFLKSHTISKKRDLTEEEVISLCKHFRDRECRLLDKEMNISREFRRHVEMYMNKNNPKMYLEYLNMCQKNNKLFDLNPEAYGPSTSKHAMQMAAINNANFSGATDGNAFMVIKTPSADIDSVPYGENLSCDSPTPISASNSKGTRKYFGVRSYNAVPIDTAINEEADMPTNSATELDQVAEDNVKPQPRKVGRPPKARATNAVPIVKAGSSNKSSNAIQSTSSVNIRAAKNFKVNKAINSAATLMSMPAINDMQVANEMPVGDGDKAMNAMTPINVETNNLNAVQGINCGVPINEFSGMNVVETINYDPSVNEISGINALETINYNPSENEVSGIDAVEDMSVYLDGNGVPAINSVISLNDVSAMTVFSELDMIPGLNSVIALNNELDMNAFQQVNSYPDMSAFPTLNSAAAMNVVTATDIRSTPTVTQSMSVMLPRNAAEMASASMPTSVIVATPAFAGEPAIEGETPTMMPVVQLTQSAQQNIDTEFGAVAPRPSAMSVIRLRNSIDGYIENAVSSTVAEASDAGHASNIKAINLVENVPPNQTTTSVIQSNINGGASNLNPSEDSGNFGSYTSSGSCNTATFTTAASNSGTVTTAVTIPAALTDAEIALAQLKSLELNANRRQSVSSKPRGPGRRSKKN